MARALSPVSCPCGGASFAACCGRFVDAGDFPSTALELMRSRYSAYVLGNAPYLLKTWHPATRPSPTLDLAGDPQKWLGLTIKNTSSTDEHHAVVEFVARYRVQGRAVRLHEISRFERIGEQWLYLDGDQSMPAEAAHG